MATEEVWRWFHRGWHEIDQEWASARATLTASDLVTTTYFRKLIDIARDKLRDDVVDLVEGEHRLRGPYLIPIRF
jgi:hypothetical protein